MMVTLPKPSGGFDWVQLPAGPALVCRAIKPYATHFFTTRHWRLADRAAGPRDGWDEVAEAAGVDTWHLGRLHQVHEADAVAYKKGGAAPGGVAPRADIALTDDSSVAIAIQTADCLPILIVDRRTRAVAAAHAGWRGLAARVPAVTVERLGREFGSRPDGLLVAVGPAIGACCYEVGDDVLARFEGAGFDAAQAAQWFTVEPASIAGNPSMPSLPAARRAGHWFFDGWQCARDQLVSAGVPGDQVWLAGLCTASHADAFCSYRRDGAAAGRAAATIRPDPLPRSPADRRAR